MSVDLSSVPRGFEYRPNFVPADEERALLDAIGRLEFSKVEMRGAVARRRTAHYGWTYGYERRRAQPGEPIPDFLLALRQRAADWAGVPADAFAEALITDYPQGAPIGWHRDAPQYAIVAGVSLLSACRMRFRRYDSPGAVSGPRPRRTATHELQLEPRSAYLMTGASRQAYEHHIPAVSSLRYSITFRTLRG